MRTRLIAQRRRRKDALRYLEMTMEGKQWIATLYSHIFAIEHNRRQLGPQPGPVRLQG